MKKFITMPAVYALYNEDTLVSLHLSFENAVQEMIEEIDQIIESFLDDDYYGDNDFATRLLEGKYRLTNSFTTVCIKKLDFDDYGRCSNDDYHDLDYDDYWTHWQIPAVVDYIRKRQKEINEAEAAQ